MAPRRIFLLAVAFLAGALLAGIWLSTRASAFVSVAFCTRFACTAVCFLIAASVWCFRPNQPLSRHLAVCGASIAAACLSGAGADPGVWDGSLFDLPGRLGLALFMASLVSLCWCTPFHLPKAHLAAGLAYALSLLAWMAGLMGGWDALRAEGGASTVLPAAALTPLGWQIAKHRRQLSAKNACSLLGLAAVALVGACFIRSGAAGSISGQASGVALLTAPLLASAYAALSISIYRVELFRIDRWVWNLWMLVGLSALLMLLDAMTAYILGVRSTSLIVVSVVLLAWLYFPLRQLLWTRLSGHLDRHDYRTIFPFVVGELLEQKDERLSQESWIRLLRRLYAPLTVEQGLQAISQPTLGEAGSKLLLPPVANLPAVTLRYADRGSRLFTIEDERLARRLLDLVDRVARVKDAAAEGAAEERRRVAADLHDHVISILLSFVYRAKPELAQAGREAIGELREIIRALGVHGHREAASPGPGSRSSPT